jgi:hypothetical protein
MGSQRPARPRLERMDAADRLLRWERAGGTWRVIAQSAEGVLTVALDTCHGEEMERLTSDEAKLVAFVGERSSSEG